MSNTTTTTTTTAVSSSAKKTITEFSAVVLKLSVFDRPLATELLIDLGMGYCECLADGQCSPMEAISAESNLCGIMKSLERTLNYFTKES